MNEKVTGVRSWPPEGRRRREDASVPWFLREQVAAVRDLQAEVEMAEEETRKVEEEIQRIEEELSVRESLDSDEEGSWTTDHDDGNETDPEESLDEGDEVEERQVLLENEGELDDADAMAVVLNQGHTEVPIEMSRQEWAVR